MVADLNCRQCEKELEIGDNFVCYFPVDHHGVYIFCSLNCSEEWKTKNEEVNKCKKS